jgi:hypothetical protein
MTSIRDNKRSVFSNYCTTTPIYKDELHRSCIFFYNPVVGTGQGDSSNRRYNFLKEPNITAILSSSAIKLLLNRHIRT